jgi:hypothetical protein
MFHSSTATKIIMVANETLLFPHISCSPFLYQDVSFPLPSDLVDHIPCNLPKYHDCMQPHTAHVVPEDGGRILL